MYLEEWESDGSGGSARAPEDELDEEPEDELDEEVEPETIDCSGAFGAPSLAFEDEGWSPQALSPTRDTLEFFYARRAISKTTDPSGERKITVRRRSSVEDAFSEPEPVVELDGVCVKVRPGTEIAGLDVSGDALRLYIACNWFKDPQFGAGPLVVAQRKDRSSPFVIQEATIGDVQFSIGVSRDELTLFATSRDPSVDYLLTQRRSSVDAAFGEMTPVPGLPTIRNPEPIPGGLGLLGVDGSVNVSSHLVMVQRPDERAAFGAPTSDGLPVPPSGAGDYSPALSGDCRTLYFMRYHFSLQSAQVLEVGR